MSERYWVTGVQLAMLHVLKERLERERLVKDILGKQFIANYDTPKDQKKFLKWVKEADYWRTKYEGCKKRLKEAKGK